MAIKTILKLSENVEKKIIDIYNELFVMSILNHQSKFKGWLDMINDVEKIKFRNI